MLKNMSLGVRLIGGFVIVVVFTAVGGGVAFWGVNTLSTQAQITEERLSEAIVANKVNYWSIVKCRYQADLIINRDMAAIQEYDQATEQLDKFNAKLDAIVDTDEEKSAMAAYDAADAALTSVFREKVVPEVERENKQFLRQYDGETDTLVATMEELSDKIITSIQGELAEALAQSDDTLLKGRIEQLLALTDLKHWALKQYQNQADLIINQDLQTVAQFEETSRKLDASLQAARLAVDTEEERAWLAEVEAADRQFDIVFNEKVAPEVKRILEAHILRYDEETDALLATMSEATKKMADSLMAEAEESMAALEGVQVTVQYTVVGVSIFAAILGLLLGIFLTRSITKPVNAVITTLSQGSTQVESASNQVAQSSQAMAEGASEQASSLEETSASLEEMASMTRQNAEGAKQADAVAKEARDAAENGREAMKRMTQAIAEIKQSADQTAKIIKNIDEIAFQTNLLALNAAVEAARAGDAGKGFAVVAEEVRNLAQRSAEAAKTTSALIEGSQKNADNGVTVSGDVEHILDNVLSAVQKVAQLVSDVASATEEQSRGIEQVNTAVAQIDKVTQSNAASSEEAASASEELSAQAKELQEMVNTLTGIVGGNAAANRNNQRRPQLLLATDRRTAQSAPANAPRFLLTVKGNNNSRNGNGKSSVVDPRQVIALNEEDLKKF